MITMEVRIPRRVDPRRVTSIVEEVVRSRGCATAMQTSLKSYPGSIHWHLKKGSERGTLEVTFWAEGGRLWLSIHSNRAGEWTHTEAKAFKSAIEHGLAVS